MEVRGSPGARCPVCEARRSPGESATRAPERKRTCEETGRTVVTTTDQGAFRKQVRPRSSSVVHARLCFEDPSVAIARIGAPGNAIAETDQDSRGVYERRDSASGRLSLLGRQLNFKDFRSRGERRSGILRGLADGGTCVAREMTHWAQAAPRGRDLATGGRGTIGITGRYRI